MGAMCLESFFRDGYSLPTSVYLSSNFAKGAVNKRKIYYRV
jgi:hypothetical protein